MANFSQTPPFSTIRDYCRNTEPAKVRLLLRQGRGSEHGTFLRFFDEDDDDDAIIKVVTKSLNELLYFKWCSQRNRFELKPWLYLEFPTLCGPSGVGHVVLNQSPDKLDNTQGNDKDDNFERVGNAATDDGFVLVDSQGGDSC